MTPTQLLALASAALEKNPYANLVTGANTLAALAELWRAAEEVQCSCTIRERESGHCTDCNTADLRAALLALSSMGKGE